MIVSELLETDEFANREVTEKQLLRVHLARITEFVRFFNYLMDKYQWSNNHVIINDYIKDTAFLLISPEKWKDNIKISHPEISDDDLEKSSQKFSRMVQIKQRIGKRVISKLDYL